MWLVFAYTFALMGFVFAERAQVAISP